MQVIWMPEREYHSYLPEYCRTVSMSFLAVVPLVCFWIVEWHQPDRCMRQLGMFQYIPSPPIQNDRLHLQDRQSRKTQWHVEHAEAIAYWNDRENRVPAGHPVMSDRIGYHSRYMEWYRSITRRFISPRGSVPQLTVI